MTYDDLTDDERAYVDGERRMVRVFAWALLWSAVAVLVIAAAVSGVPGDDSLNGCAVPNCAEVGE